MSLFKECPHCHQLFSKAGLIEHLKSAHFKQLTALEKATLLGGSTNTSLDALHPGKKPALKNNPKNPVKKMKPEFLAMPKNTTSAMATRVLKAKIEQRERSFKQAQRNRAISEALSKSTVLQQKKQETQSPLTSKWKEEVVKLTQVKVTVKGDSYALQLQPVAPSKIPPPVDRTKRRARKPLLDQKNKKTTESWPCSCGGENERCFRCFGTGLEEISAKEALKRQARTLINVTPGGPASFAVDGVREAGRFSSAPSQDDFGEESMS